MIGRMHLCWPLSRAYVTHAHVFRKVVISFFLFSAHGECSRIWHLENYQILCPSSWLAPALCLQLRNNKTERLFEGGEGSSPIETNETFKCQGKERRMYSKCSSLLGWLCLRPHSIACKLQMVITSTKLEAPRGPTCLIHLWLFLLWRPAQNCGNKDFLSCAAWCGTPSQLENVAALWQAIIMYLYWYYQPVEQLENVWNRLSSQALVSWGPKESSISLQRCRNSLVFHLGLHVVTA